METSNDYVRNNKAKDDPSKEQDSNADVSESSGNSNPTATLKDPLADHVEAVLSPTVETEVPTVRPSIHIATTKYITADQMEPILPSKVETEVPTISSLAATDSISIPTVSSSVPRIISRGGFSYPETSFLGNAMTFEDKLEDFFEDTTNSASLTEMEADLSNMETSIQAKNMEEYGFIATIHQKTDPDLLQYCLFSCFLSQEEPKKIFDALKDPSWVEAMQEELLQFKIQNVWVLVDCPKGVRPIGTKWVLKNKRDERGIVIRNKARLVAQRYTQEEGIDYEEVFAHVARIEAIRLFLAYASYMGFTVYQMDVKSAFLYATIDEDVYVKQPPGFEDPEFPDRVYRVKRLCIDSIKLLELGMVPYPNTYWIMAFKEYYKRRMASSSHKINILKMFGYIDVRTSKTPIDRENPWGKNRPDKDVDLHLYRSMIRSLMYLTASRPDIMYLKGQPMLRLWYPKASPFDLVAYSDSDYDGDNQDRKSTTGGCQFLGRRLISWQCKKQTIMATSTTEAEYVAATSGYGQVL
ncbi:putative ribonuclease H-like domain-containing protein [Tanacetum coccineum]